MAQQIINLGASPDDGTGDTLRDGGDKINDNFTELYAGLVGLLDFKGSTDCSANPNYPAASKGDFYLVSVAGKIGGASGIVVEAGDTFFATADNAGGTQAAVGASWTVIQGNLTSYLPLTGGTLTGDLVVPAEVYGSGWDGSNEVPTKNDVYDKIESVIIAAGSVSDTVYGAGWDGVTGVAPSKNAVYDKIESVVASISAAYTDEQAQDAVGTILVDSSRIDFTYSDGTPSITADIVAGSIGTTQLANSGVTLAKIANASANSKLLGSGAAGSGSPYAEITLGTGLSMSGTTLNSTGSGAAWNLQWSPMVAEFPASNYAALDSRNNHPCLDFDAATAETIYFTGVLPNDYAGAGITVTLYWAGATATSGNVMWQASIERIDAGGQDTDSDGFASAQAFAAAAADGTSGKITKSSLNISNGANMDSLAAGDLFRLGITRDASNGSDTMTGDAQLFRVMMVSQ